MHIVGHVDLLVIGAPELLGAPSGTANEMGDGSCELRESRLFTLRVVELVVLFDRRSVVQVLKPMAETRPQPVSIHNAIADLTFLPDRTPTTTSEDSADAFARLCA